MFSALEEPLTEDNFQNDFPILSSYAASHTSKTRRLSESRGCPAARRLSEPRGCPADRNYKSTRKFVKFLGAPANGGETGKFAENVFNEVCFRTPANINNVANVFGEWE